LNELAPSLLLAEFVMFNLKLIKRLKASKRKLVPKVVDKFFDLTCVKVFRWRPL
jgi:hypothetical protein